MWCLLSLLDMLEIYYDNIGINIDWQDAMNILCHFMSPASLLKKFYLLEFFMTSSKISKNLTSTSPYFLILRRNVMRGITLLYIDRRGAAIHQGKGF